MQHQFLLIFCGSGIGGCLRYAIFQLIAVVGWQSWISTIICNAMGCFVISLCLGYFHDMHPYPKYLHAVFVIGMMGGFTTFSTFSVDTIRLFQQDLWLALGYVALSVGISLLSCMAGYALMGVILQSLNVPK